MTDTGVKVLFFFFSMGQAATYNQNLTPWCGCGLASGVGGTWWPGECGRGQPVGVDDT